MPGIRVQQAAALRLDEIYHYTRDHWGEQQAERYIEGLFRAAQGLASHTTLSWPIPADFGITDGYFFRYQHHFVYWRTLSSGDIGIVTVLHEKMHQIERFRDDFLGAAWIDTVARVSAVCGSRSGRPTRSTLAFSQRPQACSVDQASTRTVSTSVSYTSR